VSAPSFSLVLKRNCSMSPKALAGVFAGLALVVLLIGAGFALAGAWLVLPFAGLEVLLLGGAYVAYARRAADYERLEIEPGGVRVEVAKAQRVARYRLVNAKVSVQDGRVVLRDAKEELEVGRYLGAEARVELAAELQKRLIRGIAT
jgi:uncharacterized membrane protein